MLFWVELYQLGKIVLDFEFQEKNEKDRGELNEEPKQAGFRE